ncbi:MAG: hypothetical protein IPG23_26850 [Burkholderiales bacterium]|nr:hypothetical protein [Burkholderiales bacterium]
MSKHLGNLERLHKKLVVALGDKHPLVLQLQEEIVSFAATVPRRLRRESFRFGLKWVDHSITVGNS